MVLNHHLNDNLRNCNGNLQIGNPGPVSQRGQPGQVWGIFVILVMPRAKITKLGLNFREIFNLGYILIFFMQMKYQTLAQTKISTADLVGRDLHVNVKLVDQ